MKTNIIPCICIDHKPNGGDGTGKHGIRFYAVRGDKR